MASPSTSLRARVKSIIDTEFLAEGITAENDRLSPALGVDRPRCGVYPEMEFEDEQDVQVQHTRVRVQMFRQWVKKVDPNQAVDPAPIEAWAHRFKRAIQNNNGGTTEDLWFLRVTRIEYPLDPTGNVTRFEATVESWAENPAITETSG